MPAVIPLCFQWQRLLFFFCKCVRDSTLGRLQGLRGRGREACCPVSVLFADPAVRVGGGGEEQSYKISQLHSSPLSTVYHIHYTDSSFNPHLARACFPTLREGPINPPICSYIRPSIHPPSTHHPTHLPSHPTVYLPTQPASHPYTHTFTHPPTH